MNPRFILVANCRSGSFDQSVIDELLARARVLNLGSVESVLLPDTECPLPSSLGKDDIVAVFGGDGTIHGVVNNLAGWEGAVLILPGGTMNLASRRLHGDADAMAILEAVAAGHARRTRPTVVRTGSRDSLAGVMIGPGTSWNEVREAMRDLNIAELAGSAVRAFSTTSSDSRVACYAPEIGRREGYPLIEVLPTTDRMELCGYHADDLGEFAIGLAALLRHDFRSGPHETFELDGSITLAAVDGSMVGMLIDGEPAEEVRQARLAVGSSRVDLLVTAANG
ncbi:diacylglycerol kinase [Erythrobacter sp. SDW2]|uniref:diacylglycerol kinase family protein n=1 Tax=Erythrobacter sp. SDW2 TaxID=2907154 RepID=UPI001F279920|nr:diacylglycerol kinase family protein [Erythrobacter sp. SDW2]UIP07283.1 diacylglycerol kinase [Erythrobacter sp. SDW2]